jgi:hypothetical protein
MMKEEQYLTERLQDQIDWYDQKSQFNQKWFKWLRVTEIICASFRSYDRCCGLVRGVLVSSCFTIF